MDTTPATTTLARFRAELYQSVLGLRRDALFELLDAVLSSDGPTSLVRLSLSPLFRRGWSSVCDALADGSLHGPSLQRLFAQSMPPAAVAGRLLWALDGTVWPRPEAQTSPERTACRVPVAGSAGQSIVDGWEYQWLAAIPEATGSWVLPLAVDRRSLAAGTPTQLAITQVRAAQAARAPDAPRPLLLLDSHYDVAALVQAELGVDILARLARNRRFSRAPGPYAGMGAPRKHGPIFQLANPATHGIPDLTQTTSDAVYGTVTIDGWQRLHTQPAPQLELTVIRIRLAHLPRTATPPQPLWLVWHGEGLPQDLRTLQHWYARRFAIEHAFRFLKQDLGWTTIRPQTPQQADRWSGLLAAGLWQLWLAREAVTDQQLPWDRAVAATARSPGRVRRGVGALVASLGTPTRAPRGRGKSPGRRAGQCPGPRPRAPALRRGAATPSKRRKRRKSRR